MDKFIVLDTETTWDNRVMSIGAVVADALTCTPIEAKYYIIDPEYRAGGMYSDALIRKDVGNPIVCSRQKAIQDLLKCINLHKVDSVFAYNAQFDYCHLPELTGLKWYDIMRISAYIQYNSKIPKGIPHYSTGRLKSGYGVEPMLRLLSNDNTYFETHNALRDAVDELKIMRLLGYPPDKYIRL
ncbi:MAG: hypothetical protein HDQ88_00175 [Clostridia bacterium]|nr:hypothetical protein [Clostridia bacterium]